MSSKLEKDKEKQETEHDKSEPPPYSPSAPPLQQDPSAPAVQQDGVPPAPPTTSPLTNLDFTPNPLGIPTVAECVAHLGLLAVFGKLRKDVGNSDRLFGIDLLEEKGEKEKKGEDATTKMENLNLETGEGVGHKDAPAAPSTPETTNKPTAKADPIAPDSAQEKIREKKWSIFVHKAVSRFETWWSTLQSLDEYFRKPIQTFDFEPSMMETRVDGFINGPGVVFDGCLPPIGMYV